MNAGKIIAIINIALAASAGIGYAIIGDYRRGIYWVAASIMTMSITF